MAQKVFLTEDNKLIVETDNGRVDENNEITTVIQGTFEIDAADVVALIAILNDATIERVIGWIDLGYRVISTDEGIKKLNDDLRKSNESCKEYRNHYFALNEYIDVLKERNLFQRIFRKHEKNQEDK